MRQTILTCDKCKTVVNELHEISIVIKGYSGRPQLTKVPSAEWCRPCLISTGVVAWSDPDDTPPAQPITIEDIFREIAQEVIDNQN